MLKFAMGPSWTHRELEHRALSTYLLLLPLLSRILYQWTVPRLLDHPEALAAPMGRAFTTAEGADVKKQIVATDTAAPDSSYEISESIALMS